MATTYEVLTNDEKDAIKESAIRNLEYQMYTHEVELMVENAKSEPNEDSVATLESLIVEKQAQIAALK
jgi:hypothetical protein